MTQQISVRPELLRWACERAGKDIVDYAGRFPKLGAWVRADGAPTLKQLEQFAPATHTPLGYLLLDQPPVEKVPIPDFRTISARDVRRPSPDLLETIYVCQQRQEWYRKFARTHGTTPLALASSARVADDVVATGQRIRDVLHLGLVEQRHMSTWEDALRWFIGQANAAGVMVMCSGVVLNNNRRRLDPAEFRGFALADDLAPLIFVNGVDTKAAQMFTLALAHVWLGQSGCRAPMLPDQRRMTWSAGATAWPRSCSSRSRCSARRTIAASPSRTRWPGSRSASRSAPSSSFDACTTPAASRAASAAASVIHRELGVFLDKRQQTSNWARRPLSAEQCSYAACDAEVLIALDGALRARATGSCVCKTSTTTSQPQLNLESLDDPPGDDR